MIDPSDKTDTDMRARYILRDPQSLSDDELQALLSLAIASHHAPRIAYAERESTP